MLTVGIPKEIKPLEKRVGLTPWGVGTLIRRKIKVLVETEAGVGAGFGDRDYELQGAEIVGSIQNIYERADLIQKIKEPLPIEFPFFREGQIIFSFLHLASPSQCDLIRALMASKVTAVGYETVEVEEARPLLAPMSQIAGGLAAIYGVIISSWGLKHKILYPDDFLQQLSQAADQYPDPPELYVGNVVIYGGGVAGEQALKLSLEMARSITLVENSASKIETLKQSYDDMRVKIISPDELSVDQLNDADMLIGCVHQTGKRALKVMSENVFKAVSQKKKKVIMDVSIDQGGNFPEAKPTTYPDPLYVDSCGNIRFAVANIPSFCGQTASQALTDFSLPYTLSMAVDFEKALEVKPELNGAINVRDGQVLIQDIKSVHELE